MDRVPIPVVVMQHVEAAAHLRNVRSVLVRAPDVRLGQLGRHDERIAAHLDGIAVAGPYGAVLAEQALERPGAGEVFVATVRAIEDRDASRFDKLLAVTEAVPSSRAGLRSAFGWVSASSLRGVTKPLIEAARPWPREVALAACAMHVVDPGPVLSRALRDDDASLRRQALRVAGQCGRRDLVDVCLASCGDLDEGVAFEAARSALFVGERTESLGVLESLAAHRKTGGHINVSALRLVLKVVAPKRVQSILAELVRHEAQMRAVIGGIASAGDPHYAPWLIDQMENPKLTRLAGEAFSFITGLDLPSAELQRDPPEGAESGPNDDPNHEDVAMDEDDGLPWPDPAKVHAWWKENGLRFTAGTRHFMGGQPTRERCLQVLKTGCQRQRIAAAEYGPLLDPGTPLFNTAAPAWRQQRLLVGMV